MAQKKKGGLINRLILGSEKSEDYARNTLPSTRWELFWDIFKGRFGKLVIINLLVLITFIPLIALLLLRFFALMGFGVSYPFAQCFGVGYMAPPDMAGYAEYIVFQVNLVTYLALPIALMIAAIGVAGGAYVMRNLVWTEGIFVANDFLRGIRQNIKQMLLIAISFSIVFYITVMAISFADQNIAVGSEITWLFIIIKILSYLILVFFSIMTLHMITMCVTYDLSFTKLMKNATIFTVSLFPFNLFFLIMGLIPYLVFMLGSFFYFIAFALIVLLGFSLIMLIWTDFSQWIYDKYMNDKIPGAKKNRGIYEKVANSNVASLKKYREQLTLASRNSLNSRPIKPITDDDLQVAELPTMFSRGDLEKLRESKEAIYEDHARYVDEHKDDPQFQPTEEEKALLENEKERQKRIEKAKKALSKRKK